MTRAARRIQCDSMLNSDDSMLNSDENDSMLNSDTGIYGTNKDSSSKKDYADVILFLKSLRGIEMDVKLDDWNTTIVSELVDLPQIEKIRSLHLVYGNIYLKDDQKALEFFMGNEKIGQISLGDTEMSLETFLLEYSEKLRRKLARIYVTGLGHLEITNQSLHGLQRLDVFLADRESDDAMLNLERLVITWKRFRYLHFHLSMPREEMNQTLGQIAGLKNSPK